MDKNDWMMIASSKEMKLYSFSEQERQIKKTPPLALHAAIYPIEEEQQHPSARDGVGRAAEVVSHKRINDEKRFAKEVSSFLTKGYQKKEFFHLYIAASPSFLGLLRQELPKEILGCISEEIHKDLTKETLSELWKHFPSHQ